jgi:hypothetical protein
VDFDEEMILALYVGDILFDLLVVRFLIHFIEHIVVLRVLALDFTDGGFFIFLLKLTQKRITWKQLFFPSAESRLRMFRSTSLIVTISSRRSEMSF